MQKKSLQQMTMTKINIERGLIKMGRLFGTDGVRGVAGSELTIDLARSLGQAGAYVLTKEASHASSVRSALCTVNNNLET